MSEIEKFLNRVEKSTKARSKEIRLDIKVAQTIAMEIAKHLELENKLLQKIVVLQENKLLSINTSNSSRSSNSDVMDGGSF